jgi:tetratricopeptide (TPR) repeat protein
MDSIGRNLEAAKHRRRENGPGSDDISDQAAAISNANKQYPRDHYENIRIAHNQFFEENYNNAMQMYERILSVEPTNIDVMNNMAVSSLSMFPFTYYPLLFIMMLIWCNMVQVCMIKTGRHQEALDLIRRAMEYNSTCPELYLTAAFAFVNIKEGSDHAIPFLRYVCIPSLRNHVPTKISFSFRTVVLLL